ncbi:hypothetical protein TNCV_1665551 [Trichonephila clavipes]|nr:hypothetical protein TNCV_1665551 [Trichonephila clavipes]
MPPQLPLPPTLREDLRLGGYLDGCGAKSPCLLRDSIPRPAAHQEVHGFDADLCLMHLRTVGTYASTTMLTMRTGNVNGERSDCPSEPTLLKRIKGYLGCRGILAGEVDD